MHEVCKAPPRAHPAGVPLDVAGLKHLTHQLVEAIFVLARNGC